LCFLALVMADISHLGGNFMRQITTEECALVSGGWIVVMAPRNTADPATVMQYLQQAGRNYVNDMYNGLPPNVRQTMALTAFATTAASELAKIGGDLNGDGDVADEMEWLGQAIGVALTAGATFPANFASAGSASFLWLGGTGAAGAALVAGAIDKGYGPRMEQIFTKSLGAAIAAFYRT
jgi:hypothetical protein